MRSTPNQECVNDAAKLIMHRLIARVLARDHSLLDSAKAHARRIAERYPNREFVDHWEQLLKLHPAHLRARLVSRDTEMYRLRLTSPFVLVEKLGLANQELRRRIYRAAKRIAGRQSTDLKLAVGGPP